MALLSEVEAHYQDPSKAFPGGDSLVTSELASYLETVGEADPLNKIYTTTKKLDQLPTFVFFFVISQVGGVIGGRGGKGMNEIDAIHQQR